MGGQKQGLGSLKPGVDRSVHLFAAPALWTVVGCILIMRGWEWIESTHFTWYLLTALAVGTLKSLLVLDRSARKGIDRIIRMRDGTCLGAIYSWKTWLLVILMIGSGRVLRAYFTPGTVIGIIYVAVGWALLFSSRNGWLAWVRWQREQKGT